MTVNELMQELSMIKSRNPEAGSYRIRIESSYGEYYSKDPKIEVHEGSKEILLEAEDVWRKQ